MSARYAIYYSPPAGSALAEFGDRWLGRNPRTGRPLKQPRVRSLPPEVLAEITAVPRRYGFHGTLKAPFRLADGTGEDALVEAVGTFAAKTVAWNGPGLIVAPLAVANLGTFMVLRPSGPSPALDALAADCVRTFDAFRAPPVGDEATRHETGALSERQRANLRTWGYPYVMQEFRFHMTLTDAVPHRLRTHAQVALAARYDAVAEPEFRIDALSVFRQPGAGEAFREIARVPLKTVPA